MESYNMCSFVTVLSHLVKCFQGSSMLWHTSVCDFFLLPKVFFPSPCHILDWHLLGATSPRATVWMSKRHPPWAVLAMRALSLENRLDVSTRSNHTKQPQDQIFLSEVPWFLVLAKRWLCILICLFVHTCHPPRLNESKNCTWFMSLPHTRY